MAASADEPLEMNFVRKHALEQAEELGVSVRDAATRVFSNASGEWGRAGGEGAQGGERGRVLCGRTGGGWRPRSGGGGRRRAVRPPTKS